MPVYNREIAQILNKMADLLEIKDDNPFRIRAYRNASNTISQLSENVRNMVEEDRDLTELPGIGNDLSQKIEEIVNTGDLKELRELEEEIPPGLSEMMNLSQLGSKRVKKIYEELGIETVKELERAAKNNKIQQLYGLGEKTEKAILEEIKRRREKDVDSRLLWPVAEEIIYPLLEYLNQFRYINKIEVAGSYRRKKSTVGDLDILAVCEEGKEEEFMDYFVEYEDVSRITARGETKSSVILDSEVQVDLRLIPEKSYGAALHYFTGSKEHNIEIRKIAQKKGLKVNEYGIFKEDEWVGGAEEKDIFSRLELPYIMPELRENRGEIEAAKNGDLPDLIKVSDIKGDLQSHTQASDGKLSLKEMAEAAKKRGYEYLAITDHSQKVSMANGLDESRLREQIELIEEYNKNNEDNFKLLKSSEVDILKDGSLDLPDSVLKELDLVVGAIHYNFKLSRKEQTERVLKAMENPYLNIIAHPSGRLIGRRKPYEIDLKEVIGEAKNKGCILEINASPSRLDLSSTFSKIAKEIGVKMAISTDAHSGNEFDNIRFGIAEARRGWVEAQDVVNTRNLDEFMKLLKRD
ncbi:MAG: DNA polymerase/3'-5' exonuclease PolX [Halanaerobiales bacterium]